MELLASGLGAPRLALCDQRVLVPEKTARSPTRHETEWGEIGLHLVDWLRFVFSRDPCTIQSIGGYASDHGPCSGFETLVLEFADSCLAEASIRRYLQPKWTEAAQFRPAPSFHVVAEHGVAILEMPGEVTWFDESGRHDESLEMDRPLGELLSERFYRILVHGLNPSPGLSDARWARMLLREARRHRATGAKVVVSAPPDKTDPAGPGATQPRPPAP
jgi:hypothetical protein